MQESREVQDYTVQEASALFKVTNPTIYKMINTGRLKTYLIGRSRRITHESIQKLREEKS